MNRKRVTHWISNFFKRFRGFKKWHYFVFFLAIFYLYVAEILFLPYASLQLTPTSHSKFYVEDYNSYSEYLVKTKEKIELAKGVRTLPKETLQKVISYPAPFELEPDKSNFVDGKWKKAVILTHGLWDSPYYLRDVGEVLRSQGFLVRTVLLPGHGTRPVDMLHVKEESWRQTVEHIYKLTKQDAHEISMGGFSTGALLSLHTYLSGYDLKALYMLSPGTKIDSPVAFLTPIVKYIYPWIIYQSETVLHYYNARATNAVAQYMSLFKRTMSLLEKKDPKELNIPVFTLLALDDGVIDQTYTLEMLKKFTGPKMTLVFKKSETPLSQDPEDPSIYYLNDYYPDDKILSQSHISVLISKDNEYLGKESGFMDYRHLYPMVYDLPWVKSVKEKVFNEIISGNYYLTSTKPKYLTKYPVIIISYNPDFDKVADFIGKFNRSIDKQ